MKYKKDDLIIEDIHENNRSAYVRAGFVEITEVDEDVEKETLIELLVDAGIKANRTWGIKKLQEEVNKL